MNLRHALRSLTKSPGFTIVAIVTLALGIGASTAIFSVVDALLLSPLQYRDADALVQVQAHHQRQGDAALAPATFGDLASDNTSFAALAAQYFYYVNITGIETPTLVNSAEVTPGYFRLFGVAPLLGRTWSDDETEPSAPPVVVLSHALWRSQFGGREAVIGQPVTLDGVAHTIIGVMPASFKDPADVAQMWRPMRAGRDNLQERDWRYWITFGRLEPGVTLDRANVELSGVAARLAKTYPKSSEDWTLRADDLRSRVVGDYHTGLLVILGAVGCVLLITCANVAGLNLVRATVRRKEFAVRAALGASRAAILRQLLIESLVLAMFGGMAGVLLGNWNLTALLGMIPDGWLPRADEISLDPTVLGVSFAITLITGLAFGLAPGLAAARVRATDALKEQSRATVGRSTRRLRSGLVVAEISLALVLLIGAGLLGRSFLALLHTKSGLDESRVLALTVSLSGPRYDNPVQRLSFYDRALSEVAALPGVESAGFTQTSPFRWGIPVTFAPLGAEERAKTGSLPSAFYDSVSLDYFKTVGTRLLAGRTFAATDDAAAPPVVMLSETAARRYFGTENPIGRLLVAPGTTEARFEVIGVVGDIRRSGLASVAPLQVYCPLAQRTTAFATLMIRASLPPATLAQGAQAAIWRVDSDIPISDVTTMDALVRRSIAQPSIYLTLLAAFAGLAVLLAAVGLYGLIAYSVTQRTREFGIRTALGARPRDVIAQVLREAVLLIAGGVALGLAGAVVATRLLQSMVFATSVHDPVVFVLVPPALVAIALPAAILPARRATKVDPQIALRAE